jgi:hypothetical protein
MGVLFLTALPACAEDVSVSAAQNKTWSDYAARLALEEAKAYELRLKGEDSRQLELSERPALKWSNNYEATVHGSVLVWTHDGRPQVIACIYNFFTTKDEFSAEFHSLADGPLTALKRGQVVWQPAEAGIEFKPLAEIAAPAKTAPARLVQLRNIARDFSADVTIWSGTNHQLRLMTQPLLRYGNGSGELLDGAIFAYARATDPDVLLVLEVKAAAGKEPRWEYALARMHSGKLKVRYRDDEVWSAAALAPPYYQRTGPYTTFQNIPEPQVE